MAENRSKKFDGGTLLGFVALAGLIFVAVSLLTSNLINGVDLSLLKQIATYIMYGVLAIISFYYCSTKNNPLWFGLWGIAVALIVVALIV